jgi:hypothetical protein
LHANESQNADTPLGCEMSTRLEIEAWAIEVERRNADIERGLQSRSTLPDVMQRLRDKYKCYVS